MKNRIPRDFIQLLLNRIDIVDLIDARVPLRKKTGSNFFACCPFHNEKSASFSVSQAKQFYYCFGCGAHGNAIDFLMQHERLEFPEAVETLARQIGLEIPHEAQHSEKTTKHTTLYEALNHITTYYQDQLRREPRAIDYLKQRGLSGIITKEFCIGYAPPGWDHILQTFGKTPQQKQQLLDAGMLIKKEDGGYYDRFRDRIMFPIHDRRGRIVGFGGRILDLGEPKYLNSPETPIFQKGHELYGLHQSLKANRELKCVLIVEGYMDVIALFQHGITYAVATLGTATTVNHLQRLFRYTSDIVFCFDGDTAGRLAAWRALQVILPIMKDDVQLRFMFLPDKEDPDTLIRKEGKESFETRIQNALTFSAFFFQNLAAQTDLGSLDGRARFVKTVTKHLNQLPSGIFQDMMFDELAKKTRTTVAQLKQDAPIQLPQPKSTILKARPPSTLRLIMALLVQHPDLIQYLTEPLPQLEIAGYDLLIELVELLNQHPQLNTGALLEHWRDKPEGKIIAKLAQMEHIIPEKGIHHEFIDAIKCLKKLKNSHIIEHLLARAALEGLNEQEKLTLHTLINSKNE